MVEYIGFAAGTMTVVSFLPQVMQAWKTKRVDDVSFAMMALLMGGAATWIVYGVLVRNTPVILTNVFAFIFQTAIMAAKLKYSSLTLRPPEDQLNLR